MTEAEARRARQNNVPDPPPLTGGFGTIGAEVGAIGSGGEGGGLALSGRDMKYMALGTVLFVVAVILGIRSLVPVQQIVQTVAKAA